MSDLRLCSRSAYARTGACTRDGTRVCARRSARRCAIALALAAAATLPAAAAGEPPACTDPAGCEHDTGEEAAGIVVTGTKTEYVAEESPVPIQVITAETIENTAAENVEAVLSQIPDVYVRRNEQFGLGASTVRMQGLDPNKVAILIDGQRFRGGIDGVVDLRDISATGVEQIEVLRGPASSLYGSDAMAGIINIRTRGGGADPYLRLDGAGGTAGRRRIAGSHGYHLGPLRYMLSVQNEAVAIADLYGESVSEQFSGDGADDLQERSSARLRLDHSAARNDVRLIADYLDEINPLSRSRDFAATSGWHRQSRGPWSLDSDAGAYRYTRENSLAGFAEDVTYYNTKAETRLSRPLPNLLHADHLVTIGLRARDETLESPPSALGTGQAPGVDEGAWQFSPFLQAETLIGADWSLVTGLSADYHELYGIEFNPRATLTWRPLSGLRASFSAGRGYRAPDLLQLFDVDVNNVVIVGDRVSGYAIVGNPDLEPETDIGYTLFLEYTGWRGLRLSADGFRHDLEDVIGFELVCTGRNSCKPGYESPVPDLFGPVFSYQNISAAVSQGVNAAITARPTDWLDTASHKLELTLAGGWLDTENRGHIAGERGKELPFRPRFRFLPSLTYEYEPSGSLVRAWGEYDGRQYTDQTNTEEGAIDPYWMFSMRVGQRLDAVAGWLGIEDAGHFGDFELYVQAENLGDVEIDGGFGPAGPLAMVPRRNVQAGIRWTLPGQSTGGEP